MIESMLEPYLKRKAGADQEDVGVTFLILGAVYMFSSLIGGVASSLFIIELEHRLIVYDLVYFS